MLRAGGVKQALHADGARPSVPTAPDGITADVVEVASFDELKALGDAARGKIVLFNPRQMQRSRQVRRVRPRGGVARRRRRGGGEGGRGGGAGALGRHRRLSPAAHRRACSTTRRRRRSRRRRWRAEDADLIASPAARTAKRARAPQADAALRRRGRLGQRRRRSAGARARRTRSCSSARTSTRGTSAPAPSTTRAGVRHRDGRGAPGGGGRPAPRRTIRVVLFMNEENGLSGGRAYAEKHAAELPSTSRPSRPTRAKGGPVGCGALGAAGRGRHDAQAGGAARDHRRGDVVAAPTRRAPIWSRSPARCRCVNIDQDLTDLLRLAPHRRRHRRQARSAGPGAQRRRRGGDGLRARRRRRGRCPEPAFEAQGRRPTPAPSRRQLWSSDPGSATPLAAPFFAESHLSPHNAHVGYWFPNCFGAGPTMGEGRRCGLSDGGLGSARLLSTSQRVAAP